MGNPGTGGVDIQDMVEEAVDIQNMEEEDNQDMEEVMRHLQNPDMMLDAEPQVSRNVHDETYALCFELSKRKTLFVVITYKTLENKIFIVTAFHSSKKLDKLIRKNKIGRGRT